MKAVCVGEAMASEQITLAANASVSAAWDKFAKTDNWFALIRYPQGVLMGSIARAKVLEALNDGRGDQAVETLLPPKVYRVDERSTLAQALEEMNELQVNYLLVCRKDTPIGVIGSSDIIHAYKSME